MDIKKNMLKNETYLCKYASFNKDAIRFKKEEKTDTTKFTFPLMSHSPMTLI